MFTGIVSDIGTVTRIVDGSDVRRLSIATGYDRASIDIGASIACGGICMTVVALSATVDGGTVFDVEAAPETLTATNVRDWVVGARVNLERSLRLGDELGGHMVSGHVDGVATILDREDLGDAVRLTFEAPEGLARFIAPKGSVALNGTSLTVNRVEGRRFDCLIIPHTLAATTWGERKVGDRVNLEVDTVARYVARLAEAV